jgi:hypothetical protein
VVELFTVPDSFLGVEKKVVELFTIPDSFLGVE